MENISPQMKEKFLEKIEEIFKFDKNNDGKLDLEEILQYENNHHNLTEEEKKAFKRNIEHFIFQCDEDGDGQVSKEELLQHFIHNCS